MPQRFFLRAIVCLMGLFLSEYLEASATQDFEDGGTQGAISQNPRFCVAIPADEVDTFMENFDEFLREMRLGVEDAPEDTPPVYADVVHFYLLEEEAEFFYVIRDEKTWQKADGLPFPTRVSYRQVVTKDQGQYLDLKFE